MGHALGTVQSNSFFFPPVFNHIKSNLISIAIGLHHCFFYFKLCGSSFIFSSATDLKFQTSAVLHI